MYTPDARRRKKQLLQFAEDSVVQEIKYQLARDADT